MPQNLTKNNLISRAAKSVRSEDIEIDNLFEVPPRDAGHLRLVDGNVPDENARLIDRDLIELSPDNPRQKIDTDGIEALRQSLIERGQLQPIVVRPHPKIDGRFLVVIGERRWRAAESTYSWTGLKQLRCIVREETDREAFLDALVENIQRADLTILDECEAVRRLQEEFAYSQLEIAQELQRGRGWVENRVKAAKVQPMLRKYLTSEATLSVVIEANKVKDQTQLAALCRRIAAGATVSDIRGRVDVMLGRHRQPRTTPPQAPEAPLPLPLPETQRGQLPYVETGHERIGNGISTHHYTPQAPDVSLETLETWHANALNTIINTPKYLAALEAGGTLASDAKRRARDTLLKIARNATKAAEMIEV